MPTRPRRDWSSDPRQRTPPRSRSAPEDDGYFGPGSVTWRVSADLSAPVAGLRSLLIQALHPLAMAGVDQHSDWRTDPVGRLAATSAYEVTVTFGDRASGRRAAASGCVRFTSTSAAPTR